VVPANIESEIPTVGSAEHRRLLPTSWCAVRVKFSLPPAPSACRWPSEVSLHRLLELCRTENERRMAEYDARLRRPRPVPGIARVLLRLIAARN